MNVVEEGRLKDVLMYIHYHQLSDIPSSYEISPMKQGEEWLIKPPYGGQLLLVEEADRLLVTFKEA